MAERSRMIYQDVYSAQAPVVVQALKNRNFDAHYCATAAEAVDLALSLIPDTHSVTWGGSITLQEIGLLERLHAGPYEVIDRDQNTGPEDRQAKMRQAFTCDTYLTSANAISQDGVLVNVDGVGNRVAALIYGPKQVIVIAGMNKICPTGVDAVARAREIAAPANAIRLDVQQTPCSHTGFCGDCKVQTSICSHIVETRLSKPAGRIKVILVGEDLGL